MGENDVLIKVHSAPINPSDIHLLKGQLPTMKQPTILGLEGSGVVIQTGSSSEAMALNGKKVAFLALGHEDLGSWGEHIVMDRKMVFPLPDTITLSEGACALANPLTVEGMILTCQENNHKCIINSAACSMLGKMLVKACQKNGIKLITIVRREAQVAMLEQLGARHILNSSDSDFEAGLANLISQYQPTAFFDAVGGEFGNLVVKNMPPFSTTYIYGFLSGELGYTVPVADMIMKSKVVRGWLVLALLDVPEKAAKILKGSFEGLVAGDYKSTIVKSFPQDQFQEAIAFHDKHASEGKVILYNPSFNS
jgi:NADPH:quinone reductase-like Zn-dependent oxidoreductase